MFNHSLKESVMSSAPASNLNLKPLYKRVLIKVSGEALMGDKEYGQDLETIERICGVIREFSVASKAQQQALTADVQTIWVCWLPCSTH